MKRNTIHQSFDLTTDWADFGQVLTDSSDGMSTFNVTSNDGVITMTFTIKPAGDDEQANYGKLHQGRRSYR